MLPSVHGHDRERSRRASFACAALVVVGVTACAPELPEPIYESESLTYHTDLDGAAGLDLDAFFAEAEARLAYYREITGVDPGHIEYYHLTRLGTLRHYCNWDRADARSGCAWGNTIYSGRILHLHELVHAFGFAMGDPPRGIEEGMAELLHNNGGFENPGALGREIRWILDDDQFLASGLDPSSVAERNLRAAALVQFLVDTFGWEWFTDLYRSMPSDVDGAVEALERRAGMSLEQLEALFGDGPTDGVESARVMRGFECRFFPRELSTDGERQEVTLSQGVTRHEDTDYARAATYQRIGIEESGGVLALTSPSDSGAEMGVSTRTCEGDPRWSTGIARPGETMWVHMSGPGWGEFSIQGNVPGTVPFHAVLLDPMMGPECDVLVPALMTPADPPVRVTTAPGRASQLARCTAGECEAWIRVRSADAGFEMFAPNDEPSDLNAEWSSLAVCDGCAGDCTESSLTPPEDSSPLQRVRVSFPPSPTGERVFRIRLPETTLESQGLGFQLRAIEP